MSNEIRANILRAIDLITASPDESLNLDKFKSECGTLHCAAGLLTTDSYFASLGMALARTGEYNSFYRLYNWNNPDFNDYRWLNDIFGKNAFDVLFCEYGNGSADPEILSDFGKYEFFDDGELVETDWDVVPKPLTDKQLALARMRYQLDSIPAEAV